MRLFINLLLSLIVISALSCSQNTENNDHSFDRKLGFSTGPNIGEKVPAFQLPDQDGNIKSLNDLVGENGAIINFHRSASW
jgi:hypothetical protein